EFPSRSRRWTCDGNEPMSALAEDSTPPPGTAVAWASTALRDNLSTSSAPALLLTILGELVLPLESPVWTSALLYVLKGLGVEERQIIEDFDLQGSSFAFMGRTVSAGLTDAEIVKRAWDLDGVAERYEKLICAFADADPDPGDDLLFTYIALANEWRQFP